MIPYIVEQRRFGSAALRLLGLMMFFLAASTALAEDPIAQGVENEAREIEIQRLNELLVSRLTNAPAGSVSTANPPPVAKSAVTNVVERREMVKGRTNQALQVTYTNTSPDVKSNTVPESVTKAPIVLDDRHKLAIGDKLSYRILEDEEDPKPLIVSDLGDIEFPYIGRVAAENKTCKELAAEIKAALEKDYYYEASVVLAVDTMAKTRGRVYIVGAVRMPGPQEIVTDETLTLSKAILRSGGFSDYANKKNVKITRSSGPKETDKQTFVVNVGQIYDNGKIENDIPLVPGDMILVADRKIRF